MRLWPRNKILATLLAAGLSVLLLAQKFLGFGVIIVVVALLIWIPYSAYVVITKPDIRTSQLVRVLVWMLVVPAVFGIHHLRQERMRRDADKLVARINEYLRTHGHYPATVDEIGISRQQVRDMFGSMSGYYLANGRPALIYTLSFAPFAACDYDFKAAKWACSAD
jgi:hypothetical protein